MIGFIFTLENLCSAGRSVHWEMFSTSEGYYEHIGRYPKYTRGMS